MRKKNNVDLPEVFLSDISVTDKTYNLKKQNLVRKIAPHLYTSNMNDGIDNIVSRNMWQIVGLLYPNAVVSDRTAVELKPINNTIFLRTNKSRSTKIGNITIDVKKGERQETDLPFLNNLYLASPPRVILESAQKSIANKNGAARGLNRKELEEFINDIINRNGEKVINKIRDDMKVLAPRLRLEKEFEIVSKIISALLQTHAIPLQSKLAMARSKGFPYDDKRIILFIKLYQELEKTALIIRVGKTNNVLAFFESYFSNFIEGTKFAVEEAKNIIFDNVMPQNRPEDAHDIIGTYQIVSNLQEMTKIPKSFDDFIDLLRSRHKILMKGRINITSEFKTKANQAGSTLFVNPELVLGTLKEGFKIYQRLTTSFSKAIFMMFLVSETHPFDDGNGRIARIMMNSELVSNGEQKIIIPTVYRNNYLSSLRAISHNGITEPIIKTMDFAQRYTGAINWDSVDEAYNILEKTNAFRDPNEADEEGVRLILTV
jgi:fido (protein-threonine AMPylation protein)